jgi:hypothetical protein
MKMMKIISVRAISMLVGLIVLATMGCATTYGMLANLSGRNDASAEATEQEARWIEGEYKDNFGNLTGEKYIRYSGEIKGSYSNSAVNQESLKVTNLIVNVNDGLNFVLSQDRSASYTFTGTGYEKVSTDVIDSNGTKFTFEGNHSGNTLFVAPQNRDEMISILSKKESIKFQITVSPPAGSSDYYMFSFNPLNFEEAFKKIN